MFVPLKLLVLAGALALVASSLATAPAMAGKGGAGGTTSYSATLTASPNPAAAGGTKVYVTGCGYKPDAPLEIRIKHATYTEAYMVVMWANGCMNPMPLYTREAGTYTIEAWQKLSTQRNATPSLMVTTTLTVTP